MGPLLLSPLGGPLSEVLLYGQSQRFFMIVAKYLEYVKVSIKMTGLF